MSDRGGTLGSAVSSVPQVYFDLIARIIPGMVILGLIVFAVIGPDAFLRTLDTALDRVGKMGATAVLFAVIMAIVLSYACAILLWYPGYLLASSIPCLGAGWDHKGIEVGTETHRFRRWYEELKRKDAVAGERVTKVKAQVHMCEVLLAGSLLSIVVGIAASWLDSPRSLRNNVVVWVCAAGFGFCICLSRRYFVDHMIASLKNNLELIEKERKKEERLRLHVEQPESANPGN